MTRRILAFYVYDNQHELVETTTKLLWNRGIEIDSICVLTYRFIKGSNISWPWAIYIFNFINIFFRIPVMRSVINKCVGKYLFKKLINKYDFIDFQSFPSSQIELADYCISRGKEFMIGFWGSDILRASDDDVKNFRIYLDYSKVICVTESMAKKINHIYKDTLGIDYSYKFRGGVEGVLNGNKDFELLNCLKKTDIESVEQIFRQGNNCKLLVTIGYNGIAAQNHDKVIKLLSKLPSHIKEKIHLVFPMTYGLSRDYLKSIKAYLANINITYTILSKYLSNKDVCVLRFITDVFVMMQNTDGFASSVRSHVYCQNVCLIAGVYYEKVNWNNLINIIENVIENYDYYHAKCLSNKERMIPFMTWDKYLDMMCNLYK